MDSPLAPKSATPAAVAAGAAASVASPAAARTAPAAPTKSPAPPAGTAAGPEIETLPDATYEAYTPPPKPVEKKLKRRKSRSKASMKRRAERRRIRDLEIRRAQKTRFRDSDIVAESAPGSVPVENNDKPQPASEGSEDFLKGLLEGATAPDTPLLDEEGNPMEEMTEELPIVRVIKAVSNLVAYLMDHPLVPVTIGVALLVILTGKF